MRNFQSTICGLLLVAIPSIANLYADPIPVRHAQGTTHGFLVIKNADGKRIATGDITQVVKGDLVMSRVTFHFRDGSLDDDSAVFRQNGTFRLVSDHLVQYGPSFPKPVDMLIEKESGDVTTRAEDGTSRKDHLELPDDVVNGMYPNLLVNFQPSDAETRVSFVVPSSKPRLVHFSVKPAGTVPFTVAGTRRKAVDYVVHVDIGGVTGLVAPLVGKQPADAHVWILDSPTPAFIRQTGQLFEGGPRWEVEQVSAVLPR